jgi:hypothetical protein
MPRQIDAPKVAAETARAAHPETKEEEIRRKMALAIAHVTKMALDEEDRVRLLDMLGLTGDGLGHITSPLISEWSNSWSAAT